MALFKRAMARGVAHELTRRGIISFPSKQAADEAADAAADAMPAVPEVSPEAGHAPDDVAGIANKLMEIAQALMAQSGGGGAPPPGMGGPPDMGGGPPPGLPPEIAKAAAELQKIAAASDYETVANDVALACMDKAASETKQAGNLIMGGDKGNTFEQSQQVSEVAKLDAQNRPQGAYQVAVGDTALDTNKGQSGSSEVHPDKPKESPAGSNSLTTDASKSAGLTAQLKKLAGNLIMGGDKGNTFEQSQAVSEVAKLDAKNRPEGKYKVSPGGANFSETQAARIGLEKKPDVMPSRTVSGSNSVIEASKAAEEEAFVTLFKKCAADVGSYLPSKLTEDEKVAAISTMIGFDTAGRQAYLDGLYSKVGGDVSEMVAAMKGDESKKDEAKKEEKKAEANPLLDTIRKIASAASAK